MTTAPVRRLDANGDVMFGSGHADYLTGRDAATQRVTSRLRLILGEWFLDIAKGIPWFQVEGSDTPPILGGKPNLAYAQALVTDTILGTDGIKSIASLSLEFDGDTRKLSIAAEIITDDDDPFALDLLI